MRTTYSPPSQVILSISHLNSSKPFIWSGDSLIAGIWKQRQEKIMLREEMSVKQPILLPFGFTESFSQFSSAAFSVHELQQELKKKRRIQNQSQISTSEITQRKDSHRTLKNQLMCITRTAWFQLQKLEGCLSQPELYGRGTPEFNWQLLKNKILLSC